MKKIVSIICVLCMIASLMITGMAYDSDALGFRVAELRQRQDTFHQIAELARSLGEPETSPIITTASQRWWEAEDEIKEITNVNEEDYPVVVDTSVHCTDAQWAQYPVACQVWEFLRNDMGLSEVCAAGILGNMMAECGGQTLDLQPYIYGYGYYGLCMWYLEYTNGRLYWGSSVEEQLNYLKDTAEWAFDYWGYDWNYFCNMGDAYSACYLFEIVYERGTWANIRGQNALDAYYYFAQ